MTEFLRFIGGMIILFMIPGITFSQPVMEWTAQGQLPPNPDLQDRIPEEQQPGLAGVYAGITGNFLIVAGGANFPENSPWEGGNKVYWDQIYVQDLTGRREIRVEEDLKLPVPMGYGVSLSYQGELFLIGGENEEGIVDGVYSISADHAGRNFRLISHPVLPAGVKAIAGGIIGRSVYVHGIRAGKMFYCAGMRTGTGRF